MANGSGPHLKSDPTGAEIYLGRKRPLYPIRQQVPNKVSFHVYILKCADGSYYTGHTDNIEGRLSSHDLAVYGGYTASRKPLQLLWSDYFPTRAEALEHERRIKGWSRAKKQALIAGDWDLLRSLARSKGRNLLASSGRGKTDAQPDRAPPVSARGSTGLTTSGIDDLRNDRGADQEAKVPTRSVPVRGSTRLTTNGSDPLSVQRGRDPGARRPITDAALQAWLRDELGLNEYRRIVRQSESAIVVSKFEPGFSQDLFALVERLPELFDQALIRARYRGPGRSAPPAGRGAVAHRGLARGQ